MLFYLYLASIAVSVVVVHITTISFSLKLKKDNIKVIENYSWLDEIKYYSLTVLKVILPIFNLLYILYLLIFNSSIYQKLVTKLFLEGNAIFLNASHHYM